MNNTLFETVLVDSNLASIPANEDKTTAKNYNFMLKFGGLFIGSSVALIAVIGAVKLLKQRENISISIEQKLSFSKAP